MKEKKKKIKKIPLKTIEISEEFYTYIREYADKHDRLQCVANFKEYVYGSPDKRTIYAFEDNREGKLMMSLNTVEALGIVFRDGKIDEHSEPFFVCEHPNWKAYMSYQVVLYCKLSNSHLSGCELAESISGSLAYMRTRREVLKHYTEDELNEIYDTHRVSEVNKQIQWHYTESDFTNSIRQYDNCSYYDINGAHNYICTLLFPKCADYFQKLYDERKEKPVNKQLVNYFVGFLKRTHPETYNWVITQVTEMLKTTVRPLLKMGAKLLYANTDGFIIQDCPIELKTSNELGKFKKENSSDTIYMYRSISEGMSSYDVFEYVDKNGKTQRKGTAFNIMKDMMSLKDGKVVDYIKVKSCGTFKPVDIKEKYVDIVKM